MREKNDLLFGFHSIYEALKADKRKFYKIFISNKRSLKRFEKIETIARKRKIAIEFVSSDLLERMIGSSNSHSNRNLNHQGILAKTYPLQNIYTNRLLHNANFSNSEI